MPETVITGQTTLSANAWFAFGATPLFAVIVKLYGEPVCVPAPGPAKAFAYGRYIGKRYAKFPNIIWMSGNDFQNWKDPSADAVVLAVGFDTSTELEDWDRTFSLPPGQNELIQKVLAANPIHRSDGLPDT